MTSRAPTKGEPIAAADRERSLDALRGLALFGVLAVNLVTEFRVSIFQQFLPDADAAGSALDRALSRALSLGVESKAFVLFSLLFGVGLAAQQERTGARGAAFGRYAARRLAFLLALGLVHMFLVWNGDILTLYAVLGAVAAPFLRLRTGALFAIAIALFVVHAMPLPLPSPFPSPDALREHVDAAQRAYGNGSFADALDFRVREVRPIAALLLWSAPRTLGLFFLGACAWRLRVFQEGQRGRLLVAVALVGGVLGGAAEWATRSGVSLGRAQDAAAGTGPILLGVAYAALVLLAFRSGPAARALSNLAPLGRMALTSYLTQSIALSVVFYGWGLGLFGRLGVASACALAFGLFATQAVLAALWLRHFRAGPVEWLWRSFTYGAWQPFAVARTTRARVPSRRA